MVCITAPAVLATAPAASSGRPKLFRGCMHGSRPRRYMPGYQVQQGAPARADMINRSEPGYRGWPASAGRDNSEWQRGVVQRGSTYVMWFPVDVEEYPLFYAFTADIPGVAKSDVKVQVDKDRVLTISGQRQKPSVTPQPPNAAAEQEGHSHRQERRFGRFKRFWDLPKDADVSQINASVDQGVLNVVIKKKRPEERDVMDIPVY